MSLAQLFYLKQALKKQSHQCSARKRKRKKATKRRNHFTVESLESRILLSADPATLLAPELDPAIDPNQSAIVAELDADPSDPQAENATDPQQIVISTPSTMLANPNGPVRIDLSYESANPVDDTLSGLGLRVHYDSSELTFQGLDNLFSNGLLFELESADFGNEDGAANTDQIVAVFWADNDVPVSEWPGQGTLPAQLGTLNFITAPNFSGSATINLTGDPALVDGILAEFVAEPITINAIDTLVVQSVVPIESGAKVNLSRAINDDVLNLINTETGGQGNPDVTLVGDNEGAIAGSIVLDSSGSSFKFVKTGGPLAPDNYTLMLTSATDAIKDFQVGELLDGDANGVAGTDFNTSFQIGALNSVVVSIPDFARGSGQPVDVPATQQGLPITISDGTGVTDVSFILNYDPDLLNITAISGPAGATVTSDLGTNAGSVSIDISSLNLGAGIQDLLTLTADVPSTAPYLAKQVLDISNLVVNDGAIGSDADDGVHVVAFFGEATGSGDYSSLDSQRILRNAVGLDSGFENFAVLDPVIVGDITGDGTISSLDAGRVIQEVVFGNRDEIPDFPGDPTVILDAPDPHVFFDQDLTANPGETITVPLNMDATVDANPGSFEAADILINFDPNVLQVAQGQFGFDILPGPDIQLNPFGGDQFLARVDNVNGEIQIGMAKAVPLDLQGFNSVLVNIGFTFNGQTDETARIDLVDVSLNEDGLVVIPAPEPGPDPTDGIINPADDNNDPVLGVIGNRTVDEGTELSFTATATDTDAGDTLTFNLETGAPSGASIDPTTGVFSWTPTEDQGPGSFDVTVRVTDDGSPNRFDEETITITVNEVNVAPVLGAIGDRTVQENTELSFTATATDADLPANTLTFSLDAGAPAGATIDPTTGVFSWTPTETQDGDHTVTVRVTDDGTPVLDDFETFTINVGQDPNQNPVLGAIGDQTVDEETELSFTATATDADLPANTLTFSLDAGAPAGATIDPTTGVFSWTPTETQDGDHTVTVRVTDDGTPTLDDSETFTITVNEVNVAPVLGAIGNQTVQENTELSFTATATDADLPANTLTFSLDAGAPAGATIDPTTGVFSWTPTSGQLGDHTVTVRVTDDGTPVLDDFETFTINVGQDPNQNPVLGAIGDQTVDEETELSFTATATDADLGDALTFSLDAGAPAGGDD